VYYVLMASAGSFGDSLPAQLFAGLLTTAIVFGALPWYAAWHGRIRTAAAFSLRVPSIVAVVSAILLGLSLWTLDMQVVRLMQLARGATLDRALLERVIAFASKLRELPVPLVVLCIAVVPAVFEEAFFRGYLFAALRTRSKAWGAILTSALLFGLFHVIMPNPLASERLLSSTLLGVVLGWIRWRSGSLFPGIILHICHNGLMVLVAYYEPQISAAGWAMPSPLDLQTGWQALPTLWLAVGGATSLAGAALAAICCAPPEE
jgi:sodium transport system permease protein